MSSLFSEENRFYPIVITANVILSTFLAVCSSVSTMIAGASIQGELALSDTQSIWLTTLYLLGINTTVPAANWFAGRFGYKRVYAYGVLIFSLASLLGAVANNFFLIAASRLIEGSGAGLIFPLGLALIVGGLPKEKLALGVNIYIAGAFGAGIGLGIPLAGWLSQFHSWRLIFLIIFALSLLLAYLCWHSRPVKPTQVVKPFDFFGWATFATFIVTLLIALTFAPIRSTAEGWRSPVVVGCLVTAALALLVCLKIESCHLNPILPLPLFKDPVFSVSLAAMFLLGMATFASVSVSIEYMLNGLLYEKYVTGKIASVYGFVIGIFSVVASYLAKKVPIPVLTFTGLSLLTFSYFYNNELSWLTGYSQVVTILFIRGLGIGLALGPTTNLALMEVPAELKASAATILTFFRQIGGTYGGTLIAIFSIKQGIFHAARFGEQANTQLPGYQMTYQNLYTKFPDAAQARLAIVKNILNQAYIQGLNDALVIFGYVTAAVALILLLLLGYRYLRNEDLENRRKRRGNQPPL